MTNKDIAESIPTNGIFASRPTIDQAYDFAFRLIDSIRPEDRTAAFTALMVVSNTIAKELKNNEKNS